MWWTFRTIEPSNPFDISKGTSKHNRFKVSGPCPTYLQGRIGRRVHEMWQRPSTCRPKNAQPTRFEGRIS